MLSFEIRWGEIANRRMNAFVVVENFDVLKYAFLGFFTGRIFVQIDEPEFRKVLHFENMKRAPNLW